jgi:hypothetical protein
VGVVERLEETETGPEGERDRECEKERGPYFIHFLQGGIFAGLL